MTMGMHNNANRTSLRTRSANLSTVWPTASHLHCVAAPQILKEHRASHYDQTDSPSPQENTEDENAELTVMSRKPVQPAMLTVGQLATLWSVDKKRILALVDVGELAVIDIPSAGGYGSITKIRLADIRAAEKRWRRNSPGSDEKRRHPRRRGNGKMPPLRHFPELNKEPPEDEPDANAPDTDTPPEDEEST